MPNRRFMTSSGDTGRRVAHHAGHRPRLATVLFTVLLSWVWAQAWAQGLEARLDRTRVVEGDTVVLTLEASGDIQGEPDLAPLAADFAVLDQAQSTQITSINGRTTATRRWQLTLAPKRTGTLTVPALQLGSIASWPLQLEVVAAAQAGQSSADRPVLIEVEAEPTNPYVQAAVHYTVRVLSRVPLRQGSLSEPQAADAIVERLGEDVQYSTYRNGQRYDVIERRYVLFPQHSGPLTVEGPILSAAIPVEGQRDQSLRERFFGYDPFAGLPGMGDMFTQTRPVQMRGQPIELSVQPQPVGAPSPWLPAESVTLTESWSPDPPEFRVGEPVTRAITLRAQGLTAAQLPDLPPAATGDMRVYNDTPQLDTRTDGGGIVATKVTKTALVPTRPGTLTLPETRLPWWDTVTSQMRIATLPARTVEVLPARPGAAPAAPTTEAEPVSATRKTSTAPAAAGDGTTTGAAGPDGTSLPSTQSAAGFWPWLAAGLGMAWLLTLGLWLRERRRPRTGRSGPPPQAESRRGETLRQARARVERACRAGDARAARAALLAWGAIRWPDAAPRGLAGLGRHMDSAAAREALLTLDRSLYDEGNAPWDGTAAWAALDPELRDGERADRRSRQRALPDLYPEPG